MSTDTLTRRPEWRALAEHQGKIRDVHLRELFAGDIGRGQRFVAEAVGLYRDYSWSWARRWPSASLRSWRIRRSPR